MSRLPFELLLALRYLRPKRTFVSVITLISVLGVTLGVAVLIIVISVMSGFDQQLRDKILGFNTHLKVMPRDETMKNYAAVARIVSSNRNVRAVAPYVFGPVLMKTEPPDGQSKVGAPFVRGINPKIETNMSVLPSSIVEGKFDVSDRGLLVGTEFAHNMSLQVGDRVEIGGPSVLEKWKESTKKEGATAPVLPEYDVRGIFDVGY
jgi:lipoprotein-releasing system permease protein